MLAHNWRPLPQPRFCILTTLHVDWRYIIRMWPIFPREWYTAFRKRHMERKFNPKHEKQQFISLVSCSGIYLAVVFWVPLLGLPVGRDEVCWKWTTECSDVVMKICTPLSLEPRDWLIVPPVHRMEPMPDILQMTNFSWGSIRNGHHRWEKTALFDGFSSSLFEAFDRGSFAFSAIILGASIIVELARYCRVKLRSCEQL